MQINYKQAAGQCDEHIEYRDQVSHNGIVQRIGLQAQAWQAYEALAHDAAEQGIELKIASGYRSYERQCLIWNAKAMGARPVFDDSGVELDVATMLPAERAEKIMRWSAIPGASRHHWGSDLDVYDAAVISADYELQLITEEYGSGGPFEKLNAWLQTQIVANAAHGFFRPYCIDKGGVAAEPWHLSYAPVAKNMQQEWSAPKIRDCITQCDIALKEELLLYFDQIYSRFISVDYTLYP